MLAPASHSPSASSATPEQRLVVAVALVGGMALVALGQLTYPQRPAEARWPVWVLMGLGGVLFTAGVRLSLAAVAPSWLMRVLRRPAAYLGIAPGQALLLGLAPALALLARLAAGNAALAYHAAAAAGAWLLAIVAVVAGSWRADGPLIRLARWEGIGLALLLGAAWLLRGTATASIPTTLSGDEASGGLSAVRFITGEADNLFSIGWFSFPSLFYGLESLSIRLLGQTPAALRLISALVGALSVVALYLSGRSLFGRGVAWLAAILLAIAHFHIHFSRIGLQNIWDGLFTLLVVGSLWQGWKTGRRTSFILSGLALGLGQYFYVTFRAMPALVGVWLIAAAIFQHARLKQRLPDLVLMALIAGVVFLPLGLYFWDNPQEFNAPLQRVSIFNGWLTQEMERTGQTAGALLLQQLASSALGITHVPLKHWYTPGVPLLLPAAAAFFWLGLLWVINTWDMRHLLILLPLTATVAAGALSQDPPASQRYVVVSVLAPLLLALPLAHSAAWVSQSWPRYRGLVLGATALVVAGLAYGDLKLYFVDLYQNYVLGGINTETAQYVADYLDTQPTPADIYFFGWPRMGYFSIASIAYLAPEMQGQDVMEPLKEPPTWALHQPTLFIFLPERQAELAWVQQRYPTGEVQEVARSDGLLLFVVYEVQP